MKIWNGERLPRGISVYPTTGRDGAQGLHHYVAAQCDGVYNASFTELRYGTVEKAIEAAKKWREKREKRTEPMMRKKAAQLLKEYTVQERDAIRVYMLKQSARAYPKHEQ